MTRGQHAIELGDVVDVLRGYQDNAFDAVLCDPPYGIEFMGRKWDYDVPNAELWREVLRVCKPGAPLIAFSGTRTYHRTVVQIEDAGWEIRDQLAWMYGSGFPKSLDVSKAIDKQRDDSADVRHVCRFLRAAMQTRGVSSADLGRAFDMHSRMVDHWAARDTDSQPTLPTWNQWLTLKHVLEFGDGMDSEVLRLNGRKGELGEAWKGAEVVGEYETMPPGLVDHQFTRRDTLIRATNSDAARRWHGYGTALKPAYEPAVLARKPLDCTVAANVARWGVGALAIDACRIGYASEADKAKMTAGVEAIRERGGVMEGSWKNSSDLSGANPASDKGRWPANILLDEEAGAALDEQTGNTSKSPSAAGYTTTRHTKQTGVDIAPRGDTEIIRGYGDGGGPSRYFYCAKAGKKERDRGCEGMPTRSGGDMTDREDGSDGLNSPRAGAGRGGGSRNHHPTVKPIALMTYLARLIMPPRPGAILVPFAGSGSEMIGALAAGWPVVVGIERESEYVEIARARLKGAA